MKRQTADAILSVWEVNEECLTYTQIKQRSVTKGIIKESNDRSLSRWLGQLVKEGTLRKNENGYFLETKPKVYQVFDYLNELRRKYPNYIYEGGVGGWFSHVCALTYVNFDETLLQEVDEKTAFDIISTRIGELFEALYLLRNDILKRRCGLNQLTLNDEVIREALFGCLIRSISQHEATEDLFNKYIKKLDDFEKNPFLDIWNKNKYKADAEYVNELAQDIFFDEIEADPQSYKKMVRNESVDIDKMETEELIEKYIRINKKIEQKHKPTNNKLPHSYSLSKEESELEQTYRIAILAKVADCIKALETSTEDFGVIITRHPATMNEYFTPEHILYESMKWAASPPQEDFLKKTWESTRAEEKTFESMVAERLSHYNNLNKEIIEGLRTKPWVKKELAKLGDFDEILSLYVKKRRQYLKGTQDHFDELLKGLKELSKSDEK
jgi:hypothetical protein